jgi:MoxR-like ATPase
MLTLADVHDRFRALRERLDTVILGQDAVKEKALTCLLAGGHALLEGVPGTGKTLLALSIARLVGSRFRRIQFTPDLMPADLVGTNVYNQKTQQFEFRPGPIFTDLLLADEVNRTPPRTQSALLECMQEAAATVDGTRYRISPVVTVLATQNPRVRGTYPCLARATRLMKIAIDYQRGGGADRGHAGAAGPHGSESPRRALRHSPPPGRRWQVRIDPGIQRYILDVVTATRRDETVQIGAGPRASLALLDCARARAALRGRDFVTPDDVKDQAEAVLVHRVTLLPEAEMEGTTLAEVLRRIFDTVEVPR